MNGMQIAGQCCTANAGSSGSAGCVRRTSGSNNDCLSGVYGQSSIVARNYYEAVDMCTSRGYVLCDKSCRNMGCMYNAIYVWTNLACNSTP